MGNGNSQELSNKVERHETAINDTQAHGLTMSLQLNENIAKIQEQLNILEARFETYLTQHKGEHSELTNTLKALQEEIQQLQTEMKRPQPPSAPPSRLFAKETPRSSRAPGPSMRQERGRRDQLPSREERPPVQTVVVTPPEGIVMDDNGNHVLDLGSRMQSIQAKAGTLMLHLLAHEALDIKTDKSFPGYQQKYKSMKSSYHVDTSPLYEFNS